MKNPILYPVIPIVIVLLLFSMAVSAQNLTQTIRENIVDKDTQRPLIGAEIVTQNAFSELQN